MQKLYDLQAERNGNREQQPVCWTGSKSSGNFHQLGKLEQQLDAAQRYYEELEESLQGVAVSGRDGQKATE